MFSSEFCEIFKKNLFTELVRLNASALWRNAQNYRGKTQPCWSVNPVSTIHSTELAKTPLNLPTSQSSRQPVRKRVFQKDELEQFRRQGSNSLIPISQTEQKLRLESKGTVQTKGWSSFFNLNNLIYFRFAISVFTSLQDGARKFPMPSILLLNKTDQGGEDSLKVLKM